MTTTIARSVRYTYFALLGALLVYAGVESALGSGRGPAPQACGSAENPCRLEPLVVTVPVRADVHLAGHAAAAERLTGDARLSRS